MLIRNRWLFDVLFIVFCPYVFRFTSLGEVFPRSLWLLSFGKYQVSNVPVFWWWRCPYVWHCTSFDISPNFPCGPLPFHCLYATKDHHLTLEMSNRQRNSSLQNLCLTNDYTVLMFVHCLCRQPFLVTLKTNFSVDSNLVTAPCS